VVTGQIKTFTETGIRLESGAHLEADIVITATGLAMQAYGGIELSVDGRAIDPGKTLAYKGVMISRVPNLASVFGYINASWTLKADLICKYVCRILNFMDKQGFRQVLPAAGAEAAVAPFVENFTSGYMQRALAYWPKQGSQAPWRVYQNFFRDTINLKWKAINDGVLEFSTPKKSAPFPESPALAARAVTKGSG
jgi:monooxygenase